MGDKPATINERCVRAAKTLRRIQGGWHLESRAWRETGTLHVIREIDGDGFKIWRMDDDMPSGWTGVLGVSQDANRGSFPLDALLQRIDDANGNGMFYTIYVVIEDMKDVYLSIHMNSI